MKRLRPWLAVAVLCLLGAPACAQTISSTGGLSFGSFVAGTGGLIAVTTAGGRNKTGGVILLTQGGGGTAAQFTVSGTAGSAYTITLPANDTITLSDGNNHGMALSGFVSEPYASGTLSGAGTLWLRVGATLTVGNAQAPGSYTGAFALTVHYN